MIHPGWYSGHVVSRVTAANLEPPSEAIGSRGNRKRAIVSALLLGAAASGHSGMVEAQGSKAPNGAPVQSVSPPAETRNGPAASGTGGQPHSEQTTLKSEPAGQNSLQPETTPPRPLPPWSPSPYYWPYYPPRPPAPPAPPEYVEGEPVPPGYRVEERWSTGLLLAGTLTASASYLLSVALAVPTTDDADDQAAERWMIIPLAGPWITVATRERFDCGASDCVEATPWPLIYGFLGIAQATGTALLVASALNKEKKLVVQGTTEVAISPVVHTDAVGMTLMARF